MRDPARAAVHRGRGVLHRHGGRDHRIRSVDRIPIGNGRYGPITESLQQAFYGLFSGKTADKWGWLDYVDMSAPRVAASG